jgi:TRAP-type C4-dicarboxylate transport system permease small subunit
MEEDKTALASTSFQRVFDRIEAIIGRVIDVIAASLLLFDIVILLWAIGARYLLRAPVTWVEELATVVFLWFGMLGVASALRLGIHMRLSFVVSQLSDNSRRNVETAAHCVLICFLWKLLPLAFSIIALNHPMKSPDLGIPGSVGASATFTSVVLMLFFLTNELSRRFRIGKFLATLLAILVFDYFLDRILNFNFSYHNAYIIPKTSAKSITEALLMVVNSRFILCPNQPLLSWE